VSVSIIVSAVLGGALALLLIVLLVIFVFRRRRKHGGSTSRGRRLPTFADVTLNSEITSFLPSTRSGALRSADEVSRQPAAESDDMPPPYDSVVKSSDVAAVRRRRTGDLTSPARRSQARLSLPPLSATVLPPVLRTHRRAESDAEEHVYEDPASLRRSNSGDGLGSRSADPAASCREVYPVNNGPFLSEVDDCGLSELLADAPLDPDDAVAPMNPRSELLQWLPSGSLLNIPVTSLQPRVPRVRLGTSALYSRPDSRTVDLCRTGEFPASANHLRPFSPLSAVGYAEVTDGLTHPYQIPGDDFPFIHSPQGAVCSTSAGWQPPTAVNQQHRLYSYHPEFVPRSQPNDVHSTPSGNYHPNVGPYFTNDLSLTEDQFNDTSSSSAASDHFGISQVSPLFDDDAVNGVII